jgi:hypothetical protein
MTCDLYNVGRCDQVAALGEAMDGERDVKSTETLDLTPQTG